MVIMLFCLCRTVQQWRAAVLHSDATDGVPGRVPLVHGRVPGPGAEWRLSHAQEDRRYPRCLLRMRWSESWFTHSLPSMYALVRVLVYTLAAFYVCTGQSLGLHTRCLLCMHWSECWFTHSLPSVYALVGVLVYTLAAFCICAGHS